MKIIGVVSAYYPDLIELEKNINSYLPWIDYLIIWENTPKSESNIDLLIQKVNNPKIEVRTTGKNEYLANPFNQCIRWAQTEGYTHVLTMDQDSFFKPTYFEQYIKIIENSTEDKVAAFGPNSCHRNEKGGEIVQVKYIFLSGAIFPIDSFLKLGCFDEKLLIDAIDTEFCLRSIDQKYKVLLLLPIYLDHEMGYRRKHWTGLTLVSYSAQRTYYFIRNSLWLWKRFPENYERQYQRSFVKYRIVYRALKLIFEPDTILKFSALVMALWHAHTGQLGRYDKFAKRK